jgi:hypothetical protein
MKSSGYEFTACFTLSGTMAEDASTAQLFDECTDCLSAFDAVSNPKDIRNGFKSF